MDSSDDSFAWTSASRSDSDSKDSSMSAADKTTAEDGDSADNKKKLQKRLFEEGQGTSEDEPPRKRKKKLKREREATPAHTPRVKLEPESDADAELARRVKLEKSVHTHTKIHDVPTSESNMFVNDDTKSEKKKSKKSKRNSSLNTEPESDADVELACRVKLEKSVHTPTKRHELPTGESNMFVNNDTKSEKKKSKKKKRNRSLNTNTDVKDMVVEDMFSAEETIVEKRQTNISEDLSQKNHREHKSKDGNNEASKINTSSKEFVSSDNSSSDDDGKRKKIKNKKINDRNFHTETEIKQIGSDYHDSSSHTQEPTFESVKHTHQKPKMSDRIQYEDENDSEPINQIITNGQHNNTATNIQFEDDSEVEAQIPTNNIATQSTRLKRFIKSNPHLKAITPSTGSDSLFTPHDEVWVLKCPHEVEISSLKGKDLQLDSKCKLKIDGQAYDGSLNEERGRVAILSTENNQIIINSLPLIGTVIFRKRIPKPHFVQDNVLLNNQTNFIPLPDTKCRHPLFGSNYKKAMKIPSAIKARLKLENEPQQEHSEKKKKKKKKHREEVSGEEPEPEPETAHESHKKRKHQLLTEEVEEDMPLPKKSKKSKKIKNEVFADTWESEKAIEESLFSF